MSTETDKSITELLGTMIAASAKIVLTSVWAIAYFAAKAFIAAGAALWVLDDLLTTLIRVVL